MARAGWQHVKKPETFVAERGHVGRRHVGRGLQGLERGEAVGRLLLVRSPRLAAGPVDRLAAGGGEQPGPGVVGQAIAGPSLERGDARLLERVLGEVEVAERADERREDLARLTPEDLLGRHATAGVSPAAP